MPEPSHIRQGLRTAVPVIPPTFALGITFGVLAKPVMGSLAPFVMSVVVFSGSAQFAALGVLQAGGAAGAAIAGGVLMNTRFLPMSFAIAPALRGRRLRRAVEAQALIDTSFAISARGDGSFDRGLLIGATIPQAMAWIGGTAVGLLAIGSIPAPSKLGLDAVFPAFYLTLLVGEARSRKAGACAALAAAVALTLMPFVPPGVPVIAASGAALLGLRRT